ncbi:MAG: hypothetical protein DMF04_08905 [Verrucomicrobia bacterium]|nr:MAG: hypothetical protein DMF04_08905 [Verrucomicrobiota bacterium]
MSMRATAESLHRRNSHFYQCPSCNQIVDQREMSEVLIHHRHVLDGYRFNISRASSMPDENQRAGDLQQKTSRGH